MIHRAKLATAALMLAAWLAPDAIAQGSAKPTAPLSWTSADGGLHFKLPTGWVRNEPPKNSDIVFEASSPSLPSGKGVNCTLTIQVVAPTQPGLTQAALNSRLQAGASSITMDERRVHTAGGLTFIDGFLSMSPRILIAMKAFYIRGGNIYDAYGKCGGQHRGELTKDDLAIARVLFDKISVTP